MKNLYFLLFFLFAISNLSAQTDVSGTISNQTWTKENSPYRVVGDLLIASLNINPGTTISFTGDYKFEVAGLLEAIGTEIEPIFFTQDSAEVYWNGILFQNTVPGSKLKWCVIEFANNSGIRIIESYPLLMNCILRNNQTVNSGGGLFISNTSPGEFVVDSCMIVNNSTSTNYTMSGSNGGGIYVLADSGVTVKFNSCIIDSNYAYRGDGTVLGGGGWISGNVEFQNCRIGRNKVRGNDGVPGGSSSGRGGGLYIENGEISFYNSTIEQNSASGYAPGGFSGNKGYASGGGLHINEGKIQFLNSIVSYNTVSGSHGSAGSGLYSNAGNTSLVNSTLAYNNGHAIENNSSEVSVLNSILYFNNNDNEQVAGTISITYSDVQGGATGEGNINYNPVFYNDTTLIIVEGSPCIDAGNPDPAYNDKSFPPSLGGERNDMGAHGGPGSINWVTSIEPSNFIQPIEFELFQNYPNPFNPITIIPYRIHAQDEIEIVVHNILGQKVITLFKGRQNPGRHQVQWNGKNAYGVNVASGQYIYELRTNEIIKRKRMILIR